MNRITIMLTIIAVVALISGILAFKAPKIYGLDLCTTTTTGLCPQQCPNFIAASTIARGTPVQNIVCTTISNAALPETPVPTEMHKIN